MPCNHLKSDIEPNPNYSDLQKEQVKERIIQYELTHLYEHIDATKSIQERAYDIARILHDIFIAFDNEHLFDSEIEMIEAEETLAPNEQDWVKVINDIKDNTCESSEIENSNVTLAKESFTLFKEKVKEAIEESLNKTIVISKR